MNRPRNLFELAGRLQRTGRNPLAVYLLGLCIVAGVSFIAGLMTGSDGMKPVEKLMPGLLVLGWYVLLFGGGGIAVVGIFLRDVITSLLVERSGLIALGVAATVYAAALFVLGDHMGGSVVAAFAGACLWRIWQIRRELGHIQGRG